MIVVAGVKSTLWEWLSVPARLCDKERRANEAHAPKVARVCNNWLIKSAERGAASVRVGVGAVVPEGAAARLSWGVSGYCDVLAGEALTARRAAPRRSSSPRPGGQAAACRAPRPNAALATARPAWEEWDTHLHSEPQVWSILGPRMDKCSCWRNESATPLSWFSDIFVAVSRALSRAVLR